MPVEKIMTDAESQRERELKSVAKERTRRWRNQHRKQYNQYMRNYMKVLREEAND